MAPNSHPIPGRLWTVRLAEELSSRVAAIIKSWPAAEKSRLGDQFLWSADSIGANITEGYVRIHIKERLQFYSIAQGSLEESLSWLRKGRDRGLIPKNEAAVLEALYFRLNKGLLNFIDSQMAGRNGGLP